MPLVFMRGISFKSADRNALEKSCDLSKFAVERLKRRRQCIVFCLIRTNEALVCETDCQFCHCARVAQMPLHKMVSRCPNSFWREMSILYIREMEAICMNFRAEDVCFSQFKR
jgi:predicted nuclease of predicted toxin-antitoxin system